MTNDAKMETALIEHVQKLMKERLVDTANEDAILEFSRAIVREVVTITTITPDPSFTWGYVTMGPGGKGGGSSRKKANVKLNLGKVVRFAASATLGVFSAIAFPPLIVLAGITLWDDFWSLREIDLSERHATVIWTMWQNRDEDTNYIDDDLIYPFLTKELEKFKMPAIKVTELQDLLNDLKKMGCITRVKSKEGAWWINEWVELTY